MFKVFYAFQLAHLWTAIGGRNANMRGDLVKERSSSAQALPSETYQLGNQVAHGASSAEYGPELQLPR